MFPVDGHDDLHCFDRFVNDEVIRTKSAQGHFFGRKNIQKRTPNRSDEADVAVFSYVIVAAVAASSVCSDLFCIHQSLL